MIKTPVVGSALLVVAMVTTAVAQTCTGCSCRGGPGFRLPSGHCASWTQNGSFCDGACYPAGTSDERPKPAPKPPIHKPTTP